MLNVRLNKETEKKLHEYSKQENLSKTEVVREALAMYFSKKEVDSTPFDLGEDLFGTAGSGDPKASVNYKNKLKEKLREKHAH